ncbi:MAG: glycosyltransferase family 2 protein [Clostridiales bacterium]|nr:glycosyltransferase family 2 protein [Clostridiales bacterium]
MDISVVIPVYGCKAAVRELYERLTATLSDITAEYEIIFVNDACPQGSWSVIDEITSQDKKVVGIDLSRNFGQSKAITAGLDHASGDYIAVMDCDLQDRPEELKKLYLKAKEGYDVVFGMRKERKDTGFKKFVSKVYYKIYEKLSGFKYDPEIGNFSVCTKAVIKSFCDMREYHREYSTYICWMGYKQAFIDIETDPRKEGKSSYTFMKKLRLAEDILTSQSDSLLRVSAYVGFGLTLIAFLYIVFLVIQYFVADIDPGWTSVIAIVLLVGGLIISSNGIAGIYIGKIFMQSKDRPLYIVREIKNK